MRTRPEKTKNGLQEGERDETLVREDPIRRQVELTEQKRRQNDTGKG